MYAVFRTGGKQYRAEKGDVLRLEKIDADEGETLKFDEVLLVGEGKDIELGSPLLSGSTVSARVVRQGKSAKVPVVKFRRRQNYLKQGSHRQSFTEVEITAISGTGKAAPAADDAGTAKESAAAKKPAKKKTKKKAAKKKASSKKSAAKKKSKKKSKKKTS